MDNESLLKNKIMDAANRSFRQNIYTYTNFLDINEQSVFAQKSSPFLCVNSSFSYIKYVYAAFIFSNVL